MNQEMRSHVEMQAQENIEAGMPPEEARHATMRQFGWSESIKQSVGSNEVWHRLKVSSKMFASACEC